MNQSSRAIIKPLLIEELHTKEAMLRSSKEIASHYWNLCNKHNPENSYFGLFNIYRNDIRKFTRQIKLLKVALKEIKHA